MGPEYWWTYFPGQDHMDIMDIILYMVGIFGVDGNGFKLVNIMKKRQKISLVL